MTQEELIKVLKNIVKKCDMLINNDHYEADAYTQDTVEDIADLCNHILDGDYGKLVEVKEVDFEKELDSMIIPELKFHKALPSLFDVAKHFYKLGVKARKGE